MTIKLLLLKSGENIISDVKELISKDSDQEEEKVRGYLLIKPQKLITENNTGEMQTSISPWIYYSSDDQIVIGKDWIVTIVEPISELKLMYEEYTNDQSIGAAEQSNLNQSD